MSKTEIMNKATRLIHKASSKLKKHSPEIMVVTGVVGTVAASVMACKATTKAEDIINQMHEDLDQIHEVSEMGREDYTEEDKKKDTVIVYAQTGVKFVKLYGPAVILGTLSISSILAGHNITRKRNVSLAAAYSAIDKSFKDYRGRVVERFGEELDREFRYNIKAREIEEIEINEKGKEKVVKKTIEVVDPSEVSDYARFYDDGCNGWTKDPELNLVFLKRQQDAATDMLRRKGHLYLNEVYDMLGIPRTKAGQIVGWIYDEEHPVGDNYVDFGIYDSNKPRVRDFVNGYERTVLLDFNVDGNILDMM